MTRFDFRPGDVTAGIPVYPAGDYELELGEAKPFKKDAANGKSGNWGVRFVCKITNAPDPKFLGKKYILNCYTHNEGGQQFTKRWQLAAYGYVGKDEEKFNSEIAAIHDWGFDTEDNDVGDGWSGMEGQTVCVGFDEGINKETQDPQQEIKYIRPLNVE